MNDRVLFVIDGCGHCAKWKKFIYLFNQKLKMEKRIRIIDCTLADRNGIITDNLISKYEQNIEGYPVLFIGDSRKDGANSVIEVKAWLKARLMGDLIFPEFNEYLPNIQKYAMFNKICKQRRGELRCIENV